MSTDPIADMFSRIMNAQAVRRQKVFVPYSKMKYAIAQLLKNTKFIEDIRKFKRKNTRLIEVRLGYEGQRGRISKFIRLSRPSRRLYVKARGIRPVKSGLGFVILSTPKGVITGSAARKQNLGGELIGKVW